MGRPGTPSLLRQINDRSALDLLLTDGPLTRAGLGKLTGLSKVTASQLLARLQDRGLVEVVGVRSAGRGPSAELYAVAGEIGYLPVPGVPLLPTTVERPFKGAFQRLVGAEAVTALAVDHGLLPAGGPASADAAIRAAAAAGRGGEGFLDELARRLAVGVAAVCAVVDPALVVLAGEVGISGGTALCDRVSAAVGRIAPVHPRVQPSGVPESPVLRGALLTAVQQARETVFADTAVS